MTKLQQTINHLKGVLPRCGFKEDAWGHFQREGTATNRVTKAVTPVTVRVKLMTTAVQLATKRPGDGEWFKVATVYYKDIQFLEGDSGVKLGRYAFKVQA